MQGRRIADRRALIMIRALGAAGLLAGGVAAAGSAARAPATHTITIEAMRFQPDSLVVRAGDRIVWINRDPFPHTVVSSVGRFRSQEIGPGQTWARSMKRTGVVPYACSLHPTMKAELRVD